jgi:hypothetical protein
LENGIMDNRATLQVYRELADWYERQGQAAMRDRFLILAAGAASEAGETAEAERLRQRLLQGNPHHMLKPFSSFAQALQSTNIQIYIHDLQVNYPAETAENLLLSLRDGVPPSSTVEHNTPSPLPQTAPPIEIRDEPTLPLDSSMESLKVYPLREESESSPPSIPPVKPTHLNRPAARKSTVVPPERPVPIGVPVLRSQSAPARPPRPTMTAPSLPSPLPEAAAPSGAWLALFLFGMTVTAGIALAVYTLAHPFLPPH